MYAEEDELTDGVGPKCLLEWMSSEVALPPRCLPNKMSSGAAEKHPRRTLSHRRGAAANRTPSAETDAPRDITSLRNVPIQRIGMQKAHVGMTKMMCVARRSKWLELWRAIRILRCGRSGLRSG
jgi:hypothetical protein